MRMITARASTSTTKATSTSSSENPCARRGAKILFEYGDTACQPIHVDIEAALAGAQRDAPAIRAAIGIKPDRGEFVVDDFALRGHQRELNLARQPIDASIAAQREV